MKGQVIAMKHIKLRLTLLWFLGTVFWCSTSQAQDSLYQSAYKTLERVLQNEQQMRFADAVFIVENAYSDGSLNKNRFESQIDLLKRIVTGIHESSPLDYEYTDRETVKKHAALYSLMTDTTTVFIQDDTFYHLPFTYDFDDSFGDADWQNMFVTKLLSAGKGNCHSLPYLYKIVADEIGIQAHLALAPNHIYIKSRSEKTGWYNTELTSSSFPVDAWIMASGYVHLEAIQNGVYMKALDETESTVMCVIDLAMGYDRKYIGNDGTFVLRCCELASGIFPQLHYSHFAQSRDYETPN